MASPFRTFRKNQKVWMTGITLMAIIAFVLITPMTGLNQLGSREPAVIKTKFGSLTQSQINNLREQRKLLHQFVDLLRAQMREHQQLQQAFNVSSAVYGILGDDTDEMAIERWIYSRTAESMGIAIDDKAVNDLLAQMTVGMSDPQKLIEAVLHGVQGGINQPQLFTISRGSMIKRPWK
jgi:hypothetical protein